MSVDSRIKYHKAAFTYKALNNMTPDYITKLLKVMSQTCSLNLRSGETGALYVPFSGTVLYSGSFSDLRLSFRVIMRQKQDFSMHG